MLIETQEALAEFASRAARQPVLALDTDPPRAHTLQRQLYQCMLSTALFLKTDIERRKTHNTFGLLLWQVADFWPAGQWGSLETGGMSPGQVPGGRW